jgi:hypothetical protein
MSEMLRREIPLGLATIIIAILLFDHYVFIEFTRGISAILQDWAVVVVATGAGIGVINIVMRGIGNIQKREAYWYLEIWQIVIMIIVAVTGFIGVYGTHPTYEWIMKNMYLPIDSSIYAMVMFDITSSFYRTFRVRSRDAAVLFVCAIFTMLYNAPITGGIAPTLLIPGKWLLDIPITAAARGFKIVTALGIVGFTIRTMLWHEKPTIGVVE